MSTLSKVFVVLVLLVSVVFAMTSVARLKTTEDYRKKFVEEQTAKKDALTAKVTAEAARNAAQNELSRTRTGLQSQIDLKDTQITTLTAGKKAAEDELSNLKTTVERNAADLTSVKSELEVQSKANDRLRKEKDAAVKRSADDTEARLDAEQRLKESQLALKNAKTDNENKDEQITRLIGDCTKLDQLVSVFEKRFNFTRAQITGTAADVTTPQIAGVVTDVQRKGSDVFVIVSVGSTSDVKVGAEFILFGDGAYKGDMLVSKVFPDSSFGRLTSRGAKEVTKGDRATTRLRPGS